MYTLASYVVYAEPYGVPTIVQGDVYMVEEVDLDVLIQHG